MMRLHYDPLSTPCRAILLFAAEEGIALDLADMSVMNGDQYATSFAALNPNRQIPVLEDGDFVLTESAAILKYLAVTHESGAYPTEPRLRARIDERIDWFNTGFARDASYGIIRPTFLPQWRMASPEHNAAAIHRARTETLRWLDVLDRYIIGNARFLCGDRLTLADYFGSAFVAMLAAVDIDLAAHPQVRRWMRSMEALPGWAPTYAAFDGLIAALAAQKAQAG